MQELTKRQKQIALMRFKGMTVKAIADELGRSPKTVKNLIAVIYDKTGVNSVIELYKLDLKTGLVSKGSDKDCEVKA